MRLSSGYTNIKLPDRIANNNHKAKANVIRIIPSYSSNCRQINPFISIEYWLKIGTDDKPKS